MVLENSSLYYQYNPWWEGPYTASQYHNRPKLVNLIEQNINRPSILLLTGLRRVGKTSLIKLTISNLIQQGTEPHHIFYVSLDDYELRSLSIIDIVDHYRQIQKIRHQEPVYLFLDEVTYKSDYQIQLKNLYDKGNAKIIASSSSASVLKDKKGLLTGRERIIEVQPLSFNEYLDFKNITLKKRDEKLKVSYFEEYMRIGGMPEYVLYEDREYLTELVEDILYKDIIAHHGIKHPQLIEDLYVLLMERIGKQVSLNKIANILNISPDSAKRYLKMFEDTFLIQTVPRWGKTNETLLSPKKLYTPDVGLRNITTGFRDKGALFENIVFNAIKDLKPRYVYHQGIEIDFFTKDKQLIEVKYHQTIENKQKSLFEAWDTEHKWVIDNIFALERLQRTMNQ